MPAAQIAAIQLHALIYNWTRGIQPASIPPLQSTTPGLHPVSIQQTAPPVRGSRYPITTYYSVYRSRNDEKQSWPSWLNCSSGRFTGHPSAADRAQDRESSPAKDRRSTTTVRCHATNELANVADGQPKNIIPSPTLSGSESIKI